MEPEVAGSIPVTHPTNFSTTLDSLSFSSDVLAAFNFVEEREIAGGMWAVSEDDIMGPVWSSRNS